MQMQPTLRMQRCFLMMRVLPPALLYPLRHHLLLAALQMVCLTPAILRMRHHRLQLRPQHLVAPRAPLLRQWVMAWPRMMHRLSAVPNH